MTVLAGSGCGGDAESPANRLHRRSIVVDTHLDVPWKLDSDFRDLGKAGATPHFDIPRAKEGGLTAAFFALYVPAEYAESGGAARKAFELLDLVDSVVRNHPADLSSALSVADIRRAKAEGRIAVLTGLEGGHALEDSLGVLRSLHRLGVRYVTLTHTNTNSWADSSGTFFLPDFDPERFRIHHGLTEFGREVVREMNRLGMMVDVSHVSDETLEDVLEVSRAPVFASHSSCRAISNFPRNLTDDQIRGISKKGGVVMINVSSFFLDQAIVDAFLADREGIRADYDRLSSDPAKDPKAREEAIWKLLERIPRKRTPWTRVVDHIEHVIRIAGPDAVGLGTDFDGIEDPPEGLEDVSKLPRITEELLRRGHSIETVANVLGGNFLRFFERVEAASRSLSGESPAGEKRAER